MAGDEETSPEKGDQYRRPDGSIEVVFAAEEGRILTFREYPDDDSFAREMEDAEYAGLNEEVSSMPGVEAFRNLDM